MTFKLLIDAAHKNDIRVAISHNDLLEDFDYETSSKKQIKGNIYLAKIVRVEPSLQAAFIDYGNEKNGFLPFSEINPRYYQLGHTDKETSPSEIAISEVLKPLERPSIDSVEKEEALENKGKYNQENLETKPADENEDFAYIKNNTFVDNQGLVNIDNVEELPVHRHFETKYKIQEVIKRGQIILVQADKEERGTKGASFTTYISLAGRYSVLMPNNAKQSGVSRRIEDLEERERLKNIIQDLNTEEGSSVILRTAGQNKTRTDIKYDYDYLVRLWNSVREKALTSKAPAFIHAEGDVIKRSLRDMYNSSIDEILIQGEEAFQNAESFLKMLTPYNPPKIKLYKGKNPIFTQYRIDNQISNLYNQRVELRSGGYIIINPTEALIAIDVNSGRATSEKDIEETAFKTNIEAAHEVARQLRLRDLSGLIVIDFIDMVDPKHKRSVERTFCELMTKDRAKIQVESISSFGLLQISRQRLRPSFLEANTVICPTCNSKGYIRSAESNVISILRAIENEMSRGKFNIVRVFTNANTILYMLNNKKAEIAQIESLYQIKIEFVVEAEALGDRFAIEKLRELKREDEQALVDSEEVGNEMVEAFPFEQIAAEEKEIEKRLAEKGQNENPKLTRIKLAGGSSKTYSNNRKNSHNHHHKKKKPYAAKTDIKGRNNKDKKSATTQDQEKPSILKGLWQKIMK
jgi:ribonuclease E